MDNLGEAWLHLAVLAERPERPPDWLPPRIPVPGTRHRLHGNIALTSKQATNLFLIQTSEPLQAEHGSTMTGSTLI